jgi:hypothetical protein
MGMPEFSTRCEQGCVAMSLGGRWLMKVSGLRHVLWRLRSRIALVLTEIHQAQAPLPRPFLLYFYRKLMRSTVGWPSIRGQVGILFWTLSTLVFGT